MRPCFWERLHRLVVLLNRTATSPRPLHTPCGANVNFWTQLGGLAIEAGRVSRFGDFGFDGEGTGDGTAGLFEPAANGAGGRVRVLCGILSREIVQALLELLLAADLPPSHDGMIDWPAQPGSEAVNTASKAISKSRRFATCEPPRCEPTCEQLSHSVALVS